MWRESPWVEEALYCPVVVGGGEERGEERRTSVVCDGEAFFLFYTTLKSCLIQVFVVETYHQNYQFHHPNISYLSQLRGRNVNSETIRPSM